MGNIGMIDGFGRTIDYLRISVTDRCNLRCVYCMKEEQQEFLSSGELLTLEEWVRLCKGAALAGIRKIRITGGEPLMRQDIVELVEAISNIPGIEKVVMTSNAVHLAPLAEKLKKAGLSGVNVSIDSLDEEQYCRLTRRDVLSDALAGLAACGKVGLPVKVNCVPVAGENEKELLHLAELAKEYPMEVRFIEMMPIGEGSAFPPVKNETIRKRLEEVYGEFVQTQQDDREGPAVYYTNEHFKGRIGIYQSCEPQFLPSVQPYPHDSRRETKALPASSSGLRFEGIGAQRRGAGENTEGIAGTYSAKTKGRSYHRRSSSHVENRRIVWERLWLCASAKKEAHRRKILRKYA